MTGMLSAFMAFINPGDKVIIFEPFFYKYIYRASLTLLLNVRHANFLLPGDTLNSMSILAGILAISKWLVARSFACL
jgi:hypothetical protein